MKKILYIIVSILIIANLNGCAHKPQDFWSATASALYAKVTNNQYDEGNWQIGIEDPSRAKDKDHPSLTIRQIKQNENITETTMFSLQNTNDIKTISYIYEISKTMDDKRIDQKVNVTSTNDTYTDYSITYTLQEYHSNNYFDGQEASGIITIEDNKTIYANVPKLKETMDHCEQLLNDFQSEFNIHYQNYNFISLPQQMKEQNIPVMDEATPAISTTTDYYSEPFINAKGYSLIPSLRVDIDKTNAELLIYNVEQNDFEKKLNASLEKRNLDNCYDLIQKGDPDQQYAVYIDGETAYLYKQDRTDDEIIQDIQQHAAMNAVYIFKTTNPSYQNSMTER